MTKLDPTFKARWLEALRSGRYTQTYGRLRRAVCGSVYIGKIVAAPPGYCCLGVALDLIDPNGWKLDFNDEPIWSKDGIYDIHTYSLPGSVLFQINLSPEDENKLSRKNDALIPFAQIADYIEANL